MENRLKRTLESFGIAGEVAGCIDAAKVKRFLFIPKEGIKFSKIKNLAEDVCLRLGVASCAVSRCGEYVAFDLPKDESRTVDFNDFTPQKGLSLAVGEGIEGNQVFLDLQKAPHLLVAGTTGSGKSVFINSAICSLLKKFTSEELKLVLVDVKKVEFTPYNNIANLYLPVITEAEQAVNALNILVNEMESRYNTLATAGVRNIQDYHKQGGKMPFIVCIIDEFADLMTSNKKQIESAAQRITQKARAAGIHLILATQRPSVDVITGVIKANIPTRLAFQVSNTMDSRVIIDDSGAEDLTGQGDCLLYQPGKQPQRIAGAFISDTQIKDITSKINKIVFVEAKEETPEDNRKNLDVVFWLTLIAIYLLGSVNPALGLILGFAGLIYLRINGYWN
ncbi:MAG: FtsK/SpoIIIE domain-containing protein [Clostridium sp.]|nr:FtsK/SpoIIIE domain-containing protein [Clostridium sp.]